MSSTTPNGKATPKPAKQSLIITMKLSPESVAKLPVSIRLVPKPADADAPSDSNTTPGPTNTTDGSMAPPAANGLKRKGVPGPKPGHKRQPPAIDVNAPPRARGKPGPKKRKLDDGTGGPAHKLGPKANQGAINAHLRALDRTGKPCRRWAKAPLQLKSFTGVRWGLSNWHGLAKGIPLEPSGAKSDTNSSSDMKQENHSSAVGSDNGNSGLDTASNAPAGPNGIASSPMPEPTPVAATPA